MLWGSYLVEDVLKKYFHKREMIANASHDDATCKKQGEKHASQLQNQKRETCILDADHFHTIGNIYTKLGECWGGYISVDFPCFPHMINHF